MGQKTVRPVYKHKEEIKVAALPTQVIPSGNAGASLLAYMMVSKFIDHLPFYPQVQIFKPDGMKIPESTISGWFRKVCELLDEMLSRIKETDYLQADETPIPVLTKDKPASTHKGYQWVFYLPKENMVIFRYDASRRQSVPTGVLSDFSGCIQTDGYAGYNEVMKRADIVHITCMAHARRKFEQAQENDKDRAEHALTEIPMPMPNLLTQKLNSLEPI